MLLTVAGSSCSGKTTVARACAAIDGLVVHDFDEIGVPSDADQRWRQRSTELWIRRVLDYQADGVDVLLTGQSPLGEVLACPSAVELDGIAACLMDVADPVRVRRLAERDHSAGDFTGWARWLRGHAADPRHRPEAITGAGSPDMCWSRWSGWSRSDDRWHVKIIDTTDRTINQTALELGSWIEVSRRDQADGRLPLAKGWVSRRATRNDQRGVPGRGSKTTK